jgi:hypothetical protein
MFGVLSSRRRSHSAAVLLGCHESGHDADHKSPIPSHSSDHVLNLAKKDLEVMQTIWYLQFKTQTTGYTGTVWIERHKPLFPHFSSQKLL